MSFTSMKDIWGLLMSRGSIDLHFYVAWQSDEKLGDVMNNFFFERTAKKNLNEKSSFALKRCHAIKAYQGL